MQQDNVLRKRLAKYNEVFPANDIIPMGFNLQLTIPQIIQTVVFGFTLFPIRVLLLTVTFPVVFGLAKLSNFVIREDEKPLGWKGFILWFTCFVARVQLNMAGIFAKVIGIPADSSEACILVIAPHSTIIDGASLLYHAMYHLPPSPVMAKENLSIPILGSLMCVLKPVLVDRDDALSKSSVMKEIQLRSHTPNYPQIAMFPEGSNSNRKALMTFKPGAFVAGVPVQPLILRFNGRDTYTWTFGQNINNLAVLLFFTLTQLTVTFEMEYLDVYYPNEGEQTDSMLYANNVRRIMAAKLNMPISNWCRENGYLLDKAMQYNLNPQIVNFDYYEVSKISGLNLKEMIKILDEYSSIQKDAAGKINMKSFCQYLKPDYVGSSLEKHVLEVCRKLKINISDKLDFCELLMLVGPFVCGISEGSELNDGRSILEQIFN